MESILETLHLDDWIIQIRRPAEGGPHPVILLLHGWTGDEDSMGIFTPRLPKNALLIAPRGLYPTPLGGFAWHLHQPRKWPWVDDFHPALDALLDLLSVINFPTANFNDLRLMGFSQGAALAYTFSLYYPAKVRSLAGLSGFMPEGAEALVRDYPLKGKPIFVAHGTRDELVPIALARKAVELMSQAGAQVIFCEDNVGHKLSLNCFKGLEAFFKKY